MKFGLFFFASTFFTATAFAQTSLQFEEPFDEDGTPTVVAEDQYTYPKLTRDLATICSPAMHVPDSEYETLEVRVLKHGQPTGHIRHRSKLDVLYYPAATPTDEVLIVIGGLGAKVDSIFSRFYAHKGQELGLNVLVFPNTLTDDFILSASSRGLIGDTNTDSVDLYRAVEKSLEKLAKKKGVHNPKIKIIGYSHGALLATAIDKLNTERFRAGEIGLNIQSVMLVNPPVDLLYGLRNIDTRVKAAQAIPTTHLIEIGVRFLKHLLSVRSEPMTPERYYAFAKGLRLEALDEYSLMGIFLKRTLGPAIIASQRIEDLGVLPELAELEETSTSPLDRYTEAALRRRANSYSFEGYFVDFFGARARQEKTPPITIYEMSNKASLHAYTRYLNLSRHIFLAHNNDDMLLRPEDTAYLAKVFGRRAKFFPRGGHMGNLWQLDNVQYISDWMRD
jgi:hypothetical protein